MSEKDVKDNETEALNNAAAENAENACLLYTSDAADD